MSTISVSGLSQFLQSVSATPAAQPQVSSTSATDSTDATSAAGSTTDASSTQQAPHAHHHHGGGKGGQFFNKLETAVTAALQQAQASGSSDPNQVVEEAIKKTLSGASDPNNASGDASSTTASATPSTDPQAAKAAFFQTLQSYGVDAQQFHSDFLSAVQATQGGQSADPSSVFKSFPPGMVVDEQG